jgi:hypothetical protein
MVVRRLLVVGLRRIAAAELRGPAMRWLRVHAEYDDTHPWEALEIVATLLGHAPPRAKSTASARRSGRATSTWRWRSTTR